MTFEIKFSKICQITNPSQDQKVLASVDLLDSSFDVGFFCWIIFIKACDHSD